MPEHRYRTLGRVYVGFVVVFGITVIVHSAAELYGEPSWREWLPLAALTLLSGSVTIRVPSVGATISVSETFVFTSVLLFGAPAGTLIAALDGLIISLWLQRRDPSLKKTLFNMAAPALSIWVAAVLFYETAKISPLTYNTVPVSTVLPSLIILAAVYFLLNSWLMAWAVALERQLAAFQIWRHDFLWVSLSFFGGASVAALIVSLNRQVTFGAIAVIVPLLMISYLTFKTAFGRIEDSTAHLTQLNKLYLSTIETLAMAIDAKDQITHGHIRRVQHYAIGLARAIGVTDMSQIQAIEAAALLHDMGKLAVPEYILNKPGKLTAAEFDRMKLHASVGADILSAINFPYPVVPIVRHHHENWDGTGYPDGLAGTAIPIGARILAVVDCFDALTSDRPYRPRLTDEDALQILRERRAVMYDPLVVDTFLAVYRDAAPLDPDSPSAAICLNEIAKLGSTSDEQERHNVFKEISAGADEMAALYELASSLGGTATLQEVGDAISKHVRRLIPAAVTVLYLHDQDKNELIAEHVIGAGDFLIRGMRVGFGQRIAGWVAANRHAILNSDPTLDFGESIRSIRPVLRSSLSVPVVSGKEHLVAVLSLYSPTDSAFTDDHRRILEAVAKQIADPLDQAWKRALKRNVSVTDGALPLAREFDQLGRVSPLVESIDEHFHHPVSLIFIEVLDDKRGLPLRDRSSLARTVDAIRLTLRAGDFVFLYSETQPVVLLTRTESSVAYSMQQRIMSTFLLNAVPADRLLMGVATAPVDGNTLNELLSVARNRRRPPDSDSRQTPQVH